MSNLTDGKKALANGDFELAEKKLLKAIDLKPDNADLWWALALCSAGCRNDGELAESVKAEYERSAERGNKKPPKTTLDGEYVKNAICYEKNGKHAEFVEKLNAELEALWKDRTGKAVSLKVKRKKYTSLATIHGRIGYVAVLFYAMFALSLLWALAVVNVAVIVVSIIGVAVTLILAIAFALSAKKKGKPTKAVGGLLFAVSTIASIAMIVVGALNGSKAVQTTATVLLVVTVIVGLCGVMTKVRRGASSFMQRKTERKELDTRPTYDRKRVVERLSDGESNGNSANASDRKSNNLQDNPTEYIDDFD